MVSKINKSTAITWLFSGYGKPAAMRGGALGVLGYISTLETRVWSDYSAGQCQRGQTGPCSLWEEKKSPLFFRKFSQTRSLCGDLGWEAERDTCHESRAPTHTHTLSLPLQCDSGGRFKPQSYTLKGGMQRCHSRVREGLKIDSILGICIQQRESCVQRAVPTYTWHLLQSDWCL